MIALAAKQTTYPTFRSRPIDISLRGTDERAAASLRQGDHILVEGTLVSSTYEREINKGKKTTTVKQTVWQIPADSIRKSKIPSAPAGLNRAEKEPEAGAIRPGADSMAQPSEGAPF